MRIKPDDIPKQMWHLGCFPHNAEQARVFVCPKNGLFWFVVQIFKFKIYYLNWSNKTFWAQRHKNKWQPWSHCMWMEVDEMRPFPANCFNRFSFKFNNFLWTWNMHSEVLGHHHQKIHAKWQIGGDYDKLPLRGRTQIRLKWIGNYLLNNAVCKPVLKMSGQPMSGAAENSGLSNSSSQFCTTFGINY